MAKILKDVVKATVLAESLEVNEKARKTNISKTLDKDLKPVIKQKSNVEFQQGNVYPHSLLNDQDIDLFKSGKHHHIYKMLGSHLSKRNDTDGVYFAVWAPNAAVVSVFGSFNSWDKISHKLFSRWDGSGIWEGFIPNLGKNETYKYHIEGYNGAEIEKGDPYANYWEVRPETASITWEDNYEWKDSKWLKKRKNHNALDKPFSVYEIHLGSWKRNRDEPGKFISYREIAGLLPQYCKELGFTHVELMPVMEHPYDGSWGYQQTGYYAPTSRFGTPEDFKFLIDELHAMDIGVILDWVPSHFPYDAQGLYMFDGTHLYEHEDMRKGYHPDWKSYIFNSGRGEVKSFLISNAVYWLEQFHVDGLRVDAVASMLQLNYSRNEGEWLPNELGGTENLENVAFLKELNEAVYGEFPDIQMIAEESSTWPLVTHPTNKDGLGFGMKWMMGWMNDTTTYFRRDPIYRKWHQNDITFSIVYAFTENFMLPFSHDEVVHGKAAMIAKMPGDEWQRYANLRLLYTYMWAHPGSKLLFMGNEFAQTTEWNFEESLRWDLLEYEPHKGIRNLVTELNERYRMEPALYQYSYSYKGFEWIAADDTENCVLVFMRKGRKPKDTIITILNFTPTLLTNYRIGIPKAGTYMEIFNSDAELFWGAGNSNALIVSEKIPKHHRKNSIEILIPPLGGIMLKLVEDNKKDS